MPDEDKWILLREAAGPSLGNAVEWFGYGTYSYVSIYVSPVIGGIVPIFAVLAPAFTFRPLGKFVLASSGDKVDRQRVMNVTMTIFTTLIGLLRDWSTIGRSRRFS